MEEEIRRQQLVEAGRRRLEKMKARKAARISSSSHQSFNQEGKPSGLLSPFPSSSPLPSPSHLPFPPNPSFSSPLTSPQFPSTSLSTPSNVPAIPPSSSHTHLAPSTSQSYQIPFIDSPVPSRSSPFTHPSFSPSPNLIPSITPSSSPYTTPITTTTLPTFVPTPSSIPPTPKIPFPSLQISLTQSPMRNNSPSPSASSVTPSSTIIEYTTREVVMNEKGNESNTNGSSASHIFSPSQEKLTPNSMTLGTDRSKEMSDNTTPNLLSQIESQRSRIDLLEKELQTLEEEKKKSNHKIFHLQTDLTASINRSEQLELEKHQIQEQCEALKVIDYRNRQLVAEQQEGEVMMEKLNSELISVKSKLENIQQQKQGEITHLTNINSDLTCQVQEHVQRTHALQGNIDSLQEKNRILEEDIRKMKDNGVMSSTAVLDSGAIETVIKEKEALQKECSELQNKLNESGMMFNEQNSRVLHSEEEVEYLENEIKKLKEVHKEELTALTSKLDDSENALVVYRENMEGKDSKEEMNECTLCSKRIRELEEEKGKLREILMENAKLKSKIAEIGDTCTNCEALSKKVASLEKMLNERKVASEGEGGAVCNQEDGMENLNADGREEYSPTKSCTNCEAMSQHISTITNQYNSIYYCLSQLNDILLPSSKTKESSEPENQIDIEAILHQAKVLIEENREVTEKAKVLEIEHSKKLSTPSNTEFSRLRLKDDDNASIVLQQRHLLLQFLLKEIKRNGVLSQSIVSDKQNKVEEEVEEKDETELSSSPIELENDEQRGDYDADMNEGEQPEHVEPSTPQKRGWFGWWRKKESPVVS